jgi:very-short-patch-repair endonuclease
MVAGSVSPPRLDLANEDLVRAHVHAIWLAEASLSLGSSMTDVLNVDGDEPSLELLDHVAADVDNLAPRNRAKQRAMAVLADVLPELEGTSWWGDQWLDQAMLTIANRFRGATDRWVGLYRSALDQVGVQTAIIMNAGRQKDHNEARRLRREAEAKLDLLRSDSGRQFQSDFYSYRYFASEGFLPGYSFPRLPLSAFIPARRGTKGHDEFLSRPRFLAISEFGPRNFIYHEGSRYQIHKVEIPVPEPGGDPDERVIVRSAKVCEACGYLHSLDKGQNIDLCESCGHNMGPALHDLFRLQNVSTKRRDRINSDEEERQRQGFDLRSAVRFAGKGPITANVSDGTNDLVSLRYGHSATIWRINLGWKRRKASDPPGFTLDVERGYWAKNQDATDDDADGDPMSARQRRVVPYVDDTRNAIVITPTGLPDDADERNRMMASLQAALKTAIQVTFQLEDTELAMEALPSNADRRVLLAYESAEGGAGVLRRLVEDPHAFAQVARAALEICHFDPNTGEDLHRPNGAKEDCEAGCYDCLLSYYNQPDHRLVDRQSIAAMLRSWASATVVAGPGAVSRAEQLQQLSNQAGSELERKFLRYLDENGFHLPSRAQVLFPNEGTRPDFIYDDDFLVVYIDGPPHDFPDRQTRDAAQAEAMKNVGWSVERIRYDEDWDSLIDKRRDVFGDGL